jgi:hypothetical protein
MIRGANSSREAERGKRRAAGGGIRRPQRRIGRRIRAAEYRRHLSTELRIDGYRPEHDAPGGPDNLMRDLVSFPLAPGIDRMR